MPQRKPAIRIVPVASSCPCTSTWQLRTRLPSSIAAYCQGGRRNTCPPLAKRTFSPLLLPVHQSRNQAASSRAPAFLPSKCPGDHLPNSPTHPADECTHGRNHGVGLGLEGCSVKRRGVQGGRWYQPVRCRTDSARLASCVRRCTCRSSEACGSKPLESARRRLFCCRQRHLGPGGSACLKVLATTRHTARSPFFNTGTYHHDVSSNLVLQRHAHLWGQHHLCAIRWRLKQDLHKV